MLLQAIAVLLFILAWLVSGQEPPAAATVLATVATFLLGLGFMFGHLHVADTGDRLSVRFGPLPVFGTMIDYSRITSARRARSHWIDGWGVHWVPNRGWTFNLWGFDCVEIEHKGKVMRIGTDDAANLEQFLRSKMEPNGS